MFNIRKITLISILTLSAMFGVQFVNFSNFASAADFSSQDSMLKDMNEMKNIFSEDKNSEKENSIKKEMKKTKKVVKDKKDSKEEANITELDIKSDTLDYFPERQEIEATGKASITIPTDGSTLKADKLIFNQETKILRGYGNVRLIKDTNIMEGDFVTINLNDQNALMTNPITENVLVKLSAENAQVIAGKDIMMENGSIKPKIDRTVGVGNASFAQYGMPQLSEAKRVFYLKEKYDEKYTIKSKEIIIDARPEHDKLTIKNAQVYLKDMRLGSAGTMEFITNKQQQYVETNTPELGFLREFGTYVGPGWAFGAPFGGAMKVVPMLTIYESKLGVGGLVRYRNDKNMTEFAINSSKGSKAVLRGEQQLTDDISLVYGMNGYMNEGFMGDRIPGKIAELLYEKQYVVDDLGLTFQHRINAGIAQEFKSNWSTARVRWMGQADKPLWYFGDDTKDIYSVLEMSMQGNATVYGTGDTLGLLRIGPRLRTETNRWIQTVGYYYTVKHGDSPFEFDKYMYGTNNVYVTEGLKLNKYLSVMWTGSLALNRDAWDGKLMQENRFYVMVGPEDVKFTLGYDPVRKRTVLNCFMILGTKNANVEFKKLYIKNPDKLGVSAKEERKAEKARLEAKAEIKPSFTDKLFKRVPKATEIEPETEEKILIDETPITPKLPEHEIIVPKVMEKKVIPPTDGIKPSRFKSGTIRLRDEPPMLNPMMTPEMINRSLNQAL